jgi:hypothetical protein
VNHKDRVIRIKHINDLQEPAASTLTLNEQLFISDLLRKRRSSLPDYPFRFFPIDAMFGNMVSIPFDPPELHSASSTVIVQGDKGEKHRSVPAE